MHVLSIPRHQIETTASEYAGIIASLTGIARRPDAVSRFERAFADYVGCRQAIAVSSGRLGLHLVLQHLGLTPGDEAIIPAFNFFAVIERFRQLGLVPRFCDVDGEDLNIDPAAARRAITPKTRALLVTHMFGHPADMEALVELAERHDLILLEDCAHALGTKSGERFVGTFGKAAIFSFSVLKLVTTFGGGMITTNDEELAAAIREDLARLDAVRPRPQGLKRAIAGTFLDLGTRKLVFSFGAWPVLRLLRAVKPDIQQKMMTPAPRRTTDFDPQAVPRMHPFQMVLGRSQLSRAERFIEKRRRVDEWLNQELAGIESVQLLHPRRCGRHNGMYYGILADRAAELSDFLFRHGIDSETSEYLNCADLEIYREYHVDCPVAGGIEERIVRLPNYPSMTRRDVGRIGRVIRQFYSRTR